MTPTWQDEVLLELQAARKAVGENLIGRSRVCARRAAGLAAREYYRRLSNKKRSPNFHDLIVEFAREPDLPVEIRTITQHLVQRVEPDHSLPVHINLIADAETLFRYIRDIIDHQEIKG